MSLVEALPPLTLSLLEATINLPTREVIIADKITRFKDLTPWHTLLQLGEHTKEGVGAEELHQVAKACGTRWSPAQIIASIRSRLELDRDSIRFLAIPGQSLKRGRWYFNAAVTFTDEDYVVANNGHDSQAFSDLYQNHWPGIYRHLYFRTGNREKAEDLVQQTFLQAFEAYPRYHHRGNGSEKSWLYQIARNLLVDGYRDHSRKITYIDEANIDEASMADGNQRDLPLNYLVRKLQYEDLRKALISLKPEYRQVVVMRYLERMDYYDIARRVSKSPGAVRIILHRALKTLRTELTSS